MAKNVVRDIGRTTYSSTSSSTAAFASPEAEPESTETQSQIRLWSAAQHRPFARYS